MNKEINIWGFVGTGNQDNNAPKPSDEQIDDCEGWLGTFARQSKTSAFSVYSKKYNVQKWLNNSGIKREHDNYIYTGALLQAARNLGFKISDHDETGRFLATGFIYRTLSKRPY